MHNASSLAGRDVAFLRLGGTPSGPSYQALRGNLSLQRWVAVRPGGSGIVAVGIRRQGLPNIGGSGGTMGASKVSFWPPRLLGGEGG